MHDSWPLDLDLVAQDSLGLDLIWRVDPRSGGPGRFGAWGRRRSTPAALFCGGAGRARRSSLYSAFWGLIRPGFGSGAVGVIRVNHLRLKHGGLGLGAGRSTAKAARRPRSSPERGAWAPRARQGLRGLVQRGSRVPCGTHRALVWKETRRRRVDGELGGDGVGGVRGGADTAMLRAPDLLGSMRGCAANKNLGLGRVRDHRRREIERAELLTGDEVLAKIRRDGGGDRGSNLGENS